LYKNFDLISHFKLPKIDPFYERAQYINRTFHSFKIYAGQILKTTQVKNILPKPGDLINTKSLISSTELSQPCSITVGIQKTKKQKLPKVIAIKSIFRKI